MVTTCSRSRSASRAGRTGPRRRTSALASWPPTQAVLAELDDRKIGFITLRARHPGITKTLAVLPASAWKPTTLGRAGGKTRRVNGYLTGALVVLC